MFLLCKDTKNKFNTIFKVGNLFHSYRYQMLKICNQHGKGNSIIIIIIDIKA